MNAIYLKDGADSHHEQNQRLSRALGLNPYCRLSAFNIKGLTVLNEVRTIASLTKNHKRQRKVLNTAFFMPKIRAILCAMGVNSRIHISQYGRVNAQNKRPSLLGNMCSRLVAISDTRPPVNSGGQTLLKPQGGQPMPLNSQAPMIGQFSFSIELPANSYIKRFIAHGFNGSWFLTIQTEANQTATIRNTDTNTPKQFDSLDSIATWLASQGVDEMTVFLSNVGGAE